MTAELTLDQVVTTSAAVAATRARTQKVTALAECLRTAHDLGADLELVAAWLGGTLRQRRTGVGWRSLGDLPPPASSPSLTVAEVDATLEQLARVSGAGSQARRAALLDELFSRATEQEQRWLRGVLTGEVRQGALDALVQEALAKAAQVPLAATRRAAMLAGGTPAIAATAFTSGVEGLAAIGLEVGRPVLPMLASSAPDLASALDRLGPGEVAVDAKLDGIRLQVHKNGDEVVLATRSLDVITERLPEVVAVVRALRCDRAVLDGEAMWLDEQGRPRPFQDTAARTASGAGALVTPHFFDLLHLDGEDLLDRPARERWEALATLVPPQHLVARVLTDDLSRAEAFSRQVIAQGHEGVVLKSPQAPYDAGRRGAAWVKVKPVHTLDLVVLGVEWGSGRRRGWLSNIHLGARDDQGRFVMVGKTFKGMSDEVLAWQTRRFTELATSPTDGSEWVVTVRPEQVVEIAVDGIQRSSRYPGGIALRFARVVRYRDDKTPQEVDSLDQIRAMFAA